MTVLWHAIVVSNGDVAWTAPGVQFPASPRVVTVLQLIAGPLPTWVTSVQLAVGTKSVTSDTEQVVVTWLPSVLGPRVHVTNVVGSVPVTHGPATGVATR